MTKRKKFAIGLAASQSLITLLLLFWLFQRPQAAHAATWTVNTFSDASDGSCNDGSCSLRDAIAVSAPLDTILLPAGSYLLSPGLGQISVAKTITLTGQGATAANTIIDGGSAIRLFSISSGTTTFSNLTLRNGQPASGNGGAILTSGTGSITLDNAIVRNSTTVGNGGGIFLGGGTLNILNGSQVVSNTAVTNSNGTGGGIYVTQGTVTLSDSLIAYNSAQFAGGINLNQAGAQLTINNGQILNNAGLAALSTSFTGGGIAIGFGSVIMNSGLISGNTAFRGAGALVNSGTFTLNGGTITDNESNYGGGIYVRNASALLTINGGSISGNRSIATIFGGGALYIFQGQAVQNGGEISGNTAVNLGGAMEVRQGGFTMNGGTISGNSAGNWGGAIYNDIGAITITNGTLTDNFSLLGGGAIATGATSRNLIQNSVIYTNSTAITQTGGAILNTGTLTLTNVTLSDNFANNGGGLQNQGTATLTNVTVYENTAVANGGGLNSSSGTLNIVNSIVAGNSAATGPDCAGTLTSQGFNLIQNGSGCTVSGTTTGNLNSDPQLAALALNGGLTLNHAIGSGSPALDAGNNASCASTDQRGLGRPIDGNNDATATCDIGSFELGTQIVIGNATVTEGNSGTTAASFTVTRSLQTTGTDTVQYATAANTATAGTDFTAVPSTTLTFNPGEISKTVTVQVLGDTLDEPNETFFVRLGNPSTGVFIGQITGTGTILDDDTAPTLAIANTAVSEGNAGSQTATFTVTLSAVSGTAVTVNYATGNDTAVAPTDYTATSGSLTFAPGETQKIINVTINGDTTDEADETFLVTLSNPANATLSDGAATGTITDDDAPPSLAIADTSVTEGDSGSTTATFTVTLSAVSGKSVDVDFATDDDTAVAPSDYTATSGSLAFAPGETQKIISVTVNGDTTDEEDETFLVTLSNPANATFSDEQATATITDDDAPPNLSINNITVGEGNSGASNASFTLSLDATSSKTITVNYETLAGTAVAGTDYTPSSGTITFTPGDSQKTVNIPVIGDTIDEDNETFFVNLSSQTNAALADDQGQATINDDDAPPTISVANVTVVEGDSGTNTAVFTLSLSHASSKIITVNVATSDGSATAGEDYTAVATTLTFNPGAALSQTVSVTIHSDTISESSETIQLNLSSPTNATLGTTQATATITDDDGVFIFLPFVISP